MTEYQGIIERVRAATGADREIDGDLFFELDPDFPNFALHMSSAPDPATFATGAYTSVKAPAYTGSTDAALVLAERLLPGQQFRILGLALLAIRAEFKMTDNLNILLILPKYIILATLLSLQSQGPK